MNKPPPRFVILLAIVFAICIANLIFVWRTVEREFEDEDLDWQRRQSNANGIAVDPREARQQPSSHPPPPPPPPPNVNATIDPERRRAYAILRDANALPVPPEILSRLPRDSDVASQYGPSPILRNLESCSAFRSSVPASERYAAVAGLFNTGTNLLSELMTKNCQIDGRRRGTGMRAQVPWGKHNPPSTHRLVNVAKVAGKGVNQTAVFPMVVIKDPYHWAVSQCRHRYFSMWEHDDDHCPNIVSHEYGYPTTVWVKYALGMANYTALTGFWNGWYGDYETQRFPYAVLRFEDLLFHAEEVVDELCTCVGGRRRNGGKLQYPSESVKGGLMGHAGSNGLLGALVRYGDPTKRLEGWTRADWEHARDHLDGARMERYGYRPPPWPP